MKKVRLEVIKPWISKKVADMLGFEDEVLVGYIFGLLEEKVHAQRLLSETCDLFTTTLALFLWTLADFSCFLCVHIRVRACMCGGADEP